MTQAPPSQPFYAVAFASNENGVAPLSLSMWSLLKNAGPETAYDIRILSEGICEESQRHLHSIVSGFRTHHKLSFIDMENVYKNAPLQEKHCGAWPYSTWARIFTPTLMPDVDLLLYLDIDILVCDDCKKIFQYDMKDKAMAVVYEAESSPHAPYKNRVHIPLEYPGYFNSGVLLMNLDYFRKENVAEKVLTYANEHADKLEYPDQDALNGVLYNQVVRLHPRWNWNDLGTRRLMHRKANSTKLIRAATVKEAVESSLFPGIVHFCGLYKPWKYNNHHIMAYLYEKAVHESGLPGFNLNDGKTFKLWLRRMSHKLLYQYTWMKVRKLAKELNIISAPEK